MPPLVSRCWLDLKDGSRLRVKPGGLLLGRARDCDVRVLNPGASSQHALVRAGRDGVELIHFGRNPTLVDGSPCPQGRSTRLEAGGVVQIPGLEARIRVEEGEEPEPSGWAVDAGEGVVRPISVSPFLIGGSARDDLVLPNLPGSAITLTLSQSALYFWSAVDLSIDGRPVPAGECQPLQSGWTLTVAGHRVTVNDVSGDGYSTTKLADEALSPEAILLEQFPGRGGGRLTVFVDGQEFVAPLTRNQALLIEVLLDPPLGGEGDEQGWVSDDSIAATLWPDGRGMGREDVNRELKRLRQRLHDHGMTGYRWIVKNKTGRFSRFLLGPGVEPEFERGRLE
jgi:hypothetical protein